MNDLRLALRTLRRRPAVAAIVIPIALAVAINSALFAVVDGLLIRPLPFFRPAELVAIDYRKVGGQLPELAYMPTLGAEREALRLGVEQSPLVAAASNAGFASFFDPDLSKQAGLEVTGVDPRFFRLLALAPARGRDFTADDQLSPAVTSRDSSEPLPIVIGHALWQRTFGGDPEILGVRTLADRPVRIIGVMPAGVKFPGETNVWAPLSPIKPGGRFPAYARLATGVTVEQLAARVPQLAITPLADAVRPGNTASLLVLFGAAGLFLLVAWVQVAALIASAAVGRMREIGVRLALGAGRARLTRQFALENALLAVAALACAWLLVGPLTTLLVRMMPSELSRGQYLAPDLRTLIFGGVVTIVGLGVLTLLPSSVVRKASPMGLLHGGLGDVPVSAERLRHILLIGQIALTAMLLYLAGLTMHSFQRAVTFDYGFDAKNVLLVAMPFPKYTAADIKQLGANGVFDAQYADKQRRYAATVEALRTVPGVVAAAHFYQLPLMPKQPTDEEIVSFGGSRLAKGVAAREQTASPDFVRALGATLIAGRTFDDPELAGRDDIAMINEALADALTPPLAVLGSTVRLNVLDKEIRTRHDSRPRRIVGVIEDLADSPALPAEPAYFYPARRGQAAAVIAIRTTPSVDAALPAIRSTLDRIWEGVPPRTLGLMADDFQRMLLPYRSQAVLVSLVGGFCVPLAAIGLAGALLYSVRMRTRETAIRLALGAEPALVRRAVVRRAMVVVTTGLALGTGAGVVIGRAIEHQLLEIQPADPWTIVMVIGVLLILAWGAALVPARQASRTDPAAALRQA